MAVRWLLRALVALALLIPLITMTAPTAHADEPQLIEVTITGISSPVIDLSDPDQVIELTGTFTNTSVTPVSFTAVNFWRSKEPIRTEDELAAVLASPLETPMGGRPPPYTVESGHSQVINEGRSFEPGESAEFRVSATLGELDFPEDDAAYLVGVHVRGIADGLGGNQTLGRARILVAATTAPLPSSHVVELTAGPQRTSDGDFLDDTLASSLMGDLDALLTLGESPGGILLLDPMLLMDVRALASEHTVKGDLTSAVPEAATWAARVEKLMAQGRVLRLPWGNTQLPRAHAMGLLEDVVGWADDALIDPALRALPLAADLGSAADSDLVRELSKLGFSVAFAENATGGTLGPLSVVHISQPDARSMTEDSDSPAQRSGRRVAAELVATAPSTYLVRTVAEVPSITDVEVERAPSPLVTVEGATSFTTAVDVPIWGELSRSINDLLADASFRRDLTGTDDLPQSERAVTIALSSEFASETAAIKSLTSGPVTVLDPSKVSISAAAEFVMGSRTNNFPVTINNELDSPVTLRLVFDSESPQRIRVPSTEFVTIDAGSSQVITLTPQAASNSVVRVVGHMETRGGMRFGKSASIDITATELGRVGWIIIVISGAVVLGGTVWRIRRVQADRAKGDT